MMQLFESKLFLGHAILFLARAMEACDRRPSRLSDMDSDLTLSAHISAKFEREIIHTLAFTESPRIEQLTQS
jgi:hypothetical protein